MTLHSYPSIYNVGHSAVAQMMGEEVVVEEKVDGSQFSFGVSDAGEIMARSKGQQLVIDAPEKMFAAGVEAVKSVAGLLRPGWTYRGEYLQSPKHNALAYARTPRNHVIIFDINPALETYLSPEDRAAEAERIGFECVPVLHRGKIDLEKFNALLQTTSILGGPLVEGVVIKPSGYSLFGRDKKCLMAKFVSEKFREIHSGEWKKANPTGSDITGAIAAKYTTPARWAKAVQHLRDAGQIEDSPRDIGKILKEVGTDVHKECAEEIAAALFKWAWPHIQRQLTRGLPEWYKAQLVENQFAEIAEARAEEVA